MNNRGERIAERKIN